MYIAEKERLERLEKKEDYKIKKESYFQNHDEIQKIICNV